MTLDIANATLAPSINVGEFSATFLLSHARLFRHAGVRPQHVSQLNTKASAIPFTVM